MAESRLNVHREQELLGKIIGGSPYPLYVVASEQRFAVTREIRRDEVGAGSHFSHSAGASKKVFQNDGSRLKQRIEQARVRNASWMSARRS